MDKEIDKEIENIIDYITTNKIHYKKINNINIIDYEDIQYLYINIKILITNMFQKIQINTHINNCIDVLYLNHFIDVSIKSNIVNNTKNNKIILNTDGGVITLNYITLNQLTDNDLEIIKTVLIRTLFIKILNGNKLDNTIYIWTCDIKKELPQNIEILGPKHVNSGTTYISDYLNGVICIWRTEEMHKVLIHELIHSLNINIDKDNSIKSNIFINKYFNLKNNCDINEAYVEFLATVLNCLIYAYDHKLDEYKFNKIIELELRFSRYQVAKILKYNGYNKFEELYKDNNNTIQFEENTNIFAYYIIKTLFLENYANILSNLNIIDILRTYIYQHKTIMLLENVDYNNTNLIINSIIEYITQNKQKNIGVSLRMTCIDTINEKYIL